ncbi:MAG: uroporphyrinogen decarboxylase family protein [Bacteroidota bacterium]
MTGTERIKAALEGKWTDRRPVMLHNFMMAAREEGITMREFRENPDKAAKAFINAAEKYKTDGVLIDVDTATLAGSVGVPVDYPDDEPARTHGTLIKSMDEVAGLPSVDVAKDEGIQRWLEITRIVKNYFGDEVFVRGNCDQAPFSLASMIRGSQDLMTDLLLDPEGVHRLLEYATEAGKQFIRLMAGTGADMVSNGDSVAGPEMIQPEFYREFAFTYEKQLIDEAHLLGLPYTLHICGNTNVILEDMVKTGADALELDYLTDIHEIYRLCHNSTLFIGNLDPSGIINFGTPVQVTEKTEELLEIYKGSPRLMINAGCAIPPDTPQENIQQMVACAWADTRDV